MHIPLRIKKQVWFRDCFEIDMRVCQCKTCSNLCLMPESIRKSIRFAPIYTEHTVSGVGEFGHVIAEHNGGCPTVETYLYNVNHVTFAKLRKLWTFGK